MDEWIVMLIKTVIGLIIQKLKMYWYNFKSFKKKGKPKANLVMRGMPVVRAACRHCKKSSVLSNKLIKAILSGTRINCSVCNEQLEVKIISQRAIDEENKLYDFG